MTLQVRTPNKLNQLAIACADDWPRLMFDGFGIMVSDEQEDARRRIGPAGPRQKGELKFNWLSGGQRAGKTLFAAGMHLDACLYKRGVDNTSRRFWNNYQYATLAIAPTDALTLRLWLIGDEISKGANDAQYERKLRRARGGAFVGKWKAGRDSKGNGQWSFSNGSRVDFRSSEGYAVRLEGGQWWWITWDEWASQPDREIHKVRSDILFGRARDHDAKIMPMAWPKPETEHHLIGVIRDIEAGRDRDSQVVYLDAQRAYFTNAGALAVELRNKTKAEIDRTIHGLPAGGASIEFKQDVIDNLVDKELPRQELPDFEKFAYFDAWDLGMGHDPTVGHTFRIPIVGGKKIVTPQWKARVVNRVELPGTDTRDLDDITMAIRANRALYRSETAVDATGMGGLMAVRQLRDLNPRPNEFKSRSNDRIWGNMRLAAITNGIDCLTWGRPENDELAATVPWGLLEMPYLIQTIDQLTSFDRDAKDKDNIPDDEVWSMLIGLWYIRRWWAVGTPGIHQPRAFDVRRGTAAAEVVRRRRSSRDQRARLIPGSMAAPPGVRLIQPPKR